jgi:hypothetical protein
MKNKNHHVELFKLFLGFEFFSQKATVPTLFVDIWLLRSSSEISQFIHLIWNFWDKKLPGVFFFITVEFVAVEQQESERYHLDGLQFFDWAGL